MTFDDLATLRDKAAAAEPSDRITHRDALVDVGVEAVAPVAAWLDDPRLGAFAVRVLERLARQPASRDPAVQALARAVDSAPTAAIRTDAEDALRRLGASVVQPMRRRAVVSSATVPAGRPGVPGRGYWATHTWERADHGHKQRAYVWAEVRRGHLRQGWGWEEEQDLRLIEERQVQGLTLTDVERMAWRARRMLTTRDDGIHTDDIVVAVAVPEPDTIAIVRVIGPYEFDLDPAIRDYGHLLPVRLLAEPISRRDARVSEALTHAVRNRTRLWRIDGVGGDIEALIGG